MSYRIVLSGIRATGRLHLGNYIGAVRKFVRLASEEETNCFYFIANLHTLTTFTDPQALRRNVLDVVLDYLAAGLDPERCTIYAQSSVPETCELNTLLTNISPMGDLVRMPHFKEKALAVRQGDDEDGGTAFAEGTNAGLFQYPVLMAADILGVLATHVPVGEDQEVHVEFARELARRFNSRYGELFPSPKPMSESIRVPNLRGGGKMSKTGSDDGSIELTDSNEVIERKIRLAVTDPQRVRRTDPGDPNVCNVYTLHKYLTDDAQELDTIYQGCKTAGIGCGDCKQSLTQKLVCELEPIRERHVLLEQRGHEFAYEVLHEGGKRARRIILNVANDAKDRMGVPTY